MAKSLGMTDNEYVSKVLRRDLMMDSLNRNISGIGVSKTLFREIIYRTDPNALEILASETARNNFSVALESLGWDLSLSSLNRFLKEVLETLGWFQMEMISSENDLEFKLFHDCNYRWSVFLRACLLSMFELIHEHPEIQISDRFVKVRITKSSVHDLVGNNELLA
jgi:hypothetical protein